MDGIERDLAGQAQVIRLSVTSDVGGWAARQYGVRSVPTLVILDGDGQVIEQHTGIPNKDIIVKRVTDLS